MQATENTDVLVDKLKSTSPSDTLIVTSIQKMSNIKDDAQNKLNPNDIALINAKRLVFIVDECHRSTFGDMMQTIKHTFPKALFFGFTGTPMRCLYEAGMTRKIKSNEKVQKPCGFLDFFLIRRFCTKIVVQCRF